MEELNSNSPENSIEEVKALKAEAIETLNRLSKYIEEQFGINESESDKDKELLQGMMDWLAPLRDIIE